MPAEFVSAASRARDARAAAQEVATALAAADPGFVVFFSSSNLDVGVVARTLADALGKVPTIGCTTAGEISRLGFTTDSLVALGIPRGAITRVSYGLARGVSREPEAIGALVARMSGELGTNFREDDCSRLLGLVLIDGMRGSEEKVMAELGRVAFNQIFVGASAGDDLKFKTTHVCCDGATAEDGAVLAVLQLERPFKIVKTQSFSVSDRALEVTRATEADRVVHELDGRPAAEAYAAASGVPVDRLAEVAFLRHPVGVLVDGEPYVRSPQQVLPDGSIRFYCNIKQGGTVHLLEAGDILGDTARAFEQASAELGGASGALIFNCILRYLDIKARGLVGEVGKVYAAVPSAGFNTYGEEYLGHVNQTCTAVLFK